MAVIIEFVGPPGAGKTTHCRHFAAMLREKNFKVAVLQDVKDYIRNMNLLQRLYLFSNVLFLSGHIYIYYILTLAFYRIYSINSIYRYTRLSAFNLALHKYVKKKDIDLVLLEQWIIQELWTITIFRLKTTENYDQIRKSLKTFYFRVDHLFYFDVEMEVAAERIAMRKTSISRFDRMEPDKRLEALLKYNKYLFNLYQDSACPQKYLFSTAKTPEVNAEYFFRYMNLTGTKHHIIL